jgi:hypothetical protein
MERVFRCCTENAPSSYLEEEMCVDSALVNGRLNLRSAKERAQRQGFAEILRG